MPTKVAIYVYKDTHSQLDELCSYARAHGWTITEYIDEELGGEAMDRLICAVHAGAHDGVLQWSTRAGKPEYRLNFATVPRTSLEKHSSSDSQ